MWSSAHQLSMLGRTGRTRAPPEPDWEKLGRVAVFQDDVPAEPTEDDVVFDCRLETLDLSERQKAMLKPIESRIRDVFSQTASRPESRKPGPKSARADGSPGFNAISRAS